MAKAQLRKSISNQANLNLTPNPVNTSAFQETLPLIRQVWYVPFAWSLSYFLYWIIRGVLVSHFSLSQVGYHNWVGVFVSFAFIIVGVKTRVRTNDAEPVQETITDSKREHVLLTKVECESVPLVKTGADLEVKMKPAKYQEQASSVLQLCPQNFGVSNNRRNSEEMLPECLICQSLIQCGMAIRAVRKR